VHNEGKEFVKEAVDTGKACIEGMGGRNCKKQIKNLGEHVKNVVESGKAMVDMAKDEAMKKIN
jgi:hypothetical protein